MGRNKEFDYEQKLDIALELFWTQGYHVTSLSELESHMEINRSSIYPTYGDKRALLIKCLKKYMKSKLSAYAAISKGDQSDAVENLKSILHYAVDQSINEDRTCFAVKMAFEIALADEEVGKLLAAHDKNIEEIFFQTIKTGQDQGCIKADLNTKMTAMFFTCSSTALFKNYALNKNRETIYEMIETLIRMLRPCPK